MATTGLADIYYAAMNTGADGKVTYGEPVLLSPGMEVDLTIESQDSKLYAGNRLYRYIRAFKEGKITIGIPEIGNKHAKALLGARTDDNGGLVSSGEDTQAYVALGFKTDKDDAGAYSYFWFYKVKFGVPGESYKTRGESLTYNTPKLEGMISTSDFTDKEGKHPWKYQMDDDDPEADKDILKNWFKKVILPDEEGE